jgi:hypothetical protein
MNGRGPPNELSILTKYDVRALLSATANTSRYRAHGIDAVITLNRLTLKGKDMYRASSATFVQAWLQHASKGHMRYMNVLNVRPCVFVVLEAVRVKRGRQHS